MEQTIEELLAQKPPVLLRAGHVSIRQLAEKLRTAMKDASRGGKDTQAVQYVFGLPFVKSLKLWTQAVCKCPALKSLLHPLVIVILSAIRAKECHLIFMPYVSILLGLINDLSLECAVFIPISSSCLAALTLCANKLASKSLTAEGREPNITDVVRVSERQLKDKRVVSGLTSLLKIQLMRHVAFLARTAALPEIGWVILQALRKVAKSNPDTKQELSSLISGLDKSIVEVREKRKSGQEELFQFEFQDTSVGKLIQHSLTERKTYYPKTEEEDLEVSSDDEEKDEKDDEEEEEEQDKTRSKRSLKRERQKEKKRRLIEMSADTVIERVERKLVKIESEVVPFALSDDEEEEQESK